MPAPIICFKSQLHIPIHTDTILSHSDSDHPDGVESNFYSRERKFSIYIFLVELKYVCTLISTYRISAKNRNSENILLINYKTFY